MTLLILTLILGGSALTFLLLSRRYHKRCYLALLSDLNSLYEDTDQLALACEYLELGKNLQLSHDIADFFAKLTTLQTARAEIERDLAQPLTPGSVSKQLDKCRRYTALLRSSAEDLLAEVNDCTGAVQSYEPNAALDHQFQSSTKAPVDEDLGERRQPLEADEPALPRPKPETSESLHLGSYNYPQWLTDRPVHSQPAAPAHNQPSAPEPLQLGNYRFPSWLTDPVYERKSRENAWHYINDDLKRAGSDKRTGP